MVERENFGVGQRGKGGWLMIFWTRSESVLGGGVMHSISRPSSKAGIQHRNKYVIISFLYNMDYNIEL